MKLWILRPVEIRPYQDDPWKPWYDKTFGIVIRAETEDAARALAFDEVHGAEESDVWTNPKYTTCKELLAEGEEEYIIQDFAAA